MYAAQEGNTAEEKEEEDPYSVSKPPDFFERVVYGTVHEIQEIFDSYPCS